ncbi:MAG: ABC transporter ATP-binding protein, partial [Desulfobacterales bacterium]
HRSALFLQDYFKLMDAEPGIEGREDGIDLEDVVRSIDVRNVSFSYPDAPKAALKNISFRIEAGECLFLAGRNGAGKTTLIKLLLRLYDPTEGVILVNGRDIREYSARSLRKAFSLLMQDYSRYPFSARENIEIGDVENLEDEERMQYALNASKFGEIVLKLSEGLDTYLLRYFGHGKGSAGADLSGGEWQKLGLARSFYRDSSVLILDEPTSALDVQSETEVLMTFKQEIAGKVAIIVSHRLSAAAIADRVIFMADGELIEDGSHDKLSEGDGPYGSLYRLQQEGYSFL